MTEKHDPIVAILVKYALKQELSDEEQRLLDAWRARSDVHDGLPDLLQDPQWRDEHQRELAEAPTAEMWDNIRQHIRRSKEAEAEPIGRVAWRAWRWPAAAAIGLVLLGGGWWFGLRRANDAAGAVTRAPFMPLAAEGGDDAVTLMLGDGRLIHPATARIGERIVEAGGLSITRTINGIAYTKLSEKDADAMKPVVHSIHTGRRLIGSFQVGFPDGSRVSLDTNSQLAYSLPLRTGPEPVVEGQAFFAIAHNDPAHPLTIWTGKGQSLTVLGTSFNVRSYPGEAQGAVELYTGKLRVNRKRDNLVLDAGRRAIMTGDGELELQAMGPHGYIPAWARPPAKSPYFEFRDTPLGGALEEVAGWYGLSVVNPGDVRGVPVTGKLPHGESPEEVLQALQQVQGGHAVLQIRGDTLYVAPGS